MATQVFNPSPVGAAPASRPAMGAVLVRARAALQALVLRTRRVTDPVAECVREAAAVRREALRLMAQNPAVAAELYAAADRHEREREHGVGR
jgi:hypothetical protein